MAEVSLNFCVGGEPFVSNHQHALVVRSRGVLRIMILMYVSQGSPTYLFEHQVSLILS